MTKLTDAQRKVLEAMRDGCLISRTRNYCRIASWFSADGLPDGVPKVIKRALLDELLTGGYVEHEYPHDEAWMHCHSYRITEAGRVAFESGG